MRPFIDLWLLRKKTNYNEVELRDICNQGGIQTFYEKCCELSYSWMERKKYTIEAKALEHYCLMSGVYGHPKVYSAAVLRQNTGMSYFIRRLLIERSILQDVYPNLRDKPFLLPYYEVKRWCNLLNPGKRARIIRELKGVYTISKEEIDSFDKLLVSLGL